jgi:glutamyl-tRNA synthetase
VKQRPDFDILLARASELAKHGVRGRFAPSPSGRLHLGNLRTALLAWLQVRLAAGVFVLRMEDLDQPRVRPNSAEQILADLRWLGIDWDEGPDVGGPLGPYIQSERNDLYATALARLQHHERAFACFCSRKDIALAASAPHDTDAPLIYPGTCRSGAFETAKNVNASRSPAWRYRVIEGVTEFHDMVAGKQRQDLSREVGDFVLRRADKLFAYQLAVVVDDALMGITDVLRGADLLHSTARQIELFSALQIPTLPRFWHVPLLRDTQGRRLAKRSESTSLSALQAQGWTAQRVVGALAASIALVPPNQALSAQELRQELSAEKLSAALRRAFERDTSTVDTLRRP